MSKSSSQEHKTWEVASTFVIDFVSSDVAILRNKERIRAFLQNNPEYLKFVASKKQSIKKKQQNASDDSHK